MGEIVPEASQSKIAHVIGSLLTIFEIVHHSNEYNFAFEFCSSIYVEISTAQRAYICLHHVNDAILLFELCTSPSVQQCTEELISKS